MGGMGEAPAGIAVTSFVAVLPSIHQPYTDTCLGSMCPELRDATLVVDNTRHNRGVPASWNLGIDRMESRGSEWLVIVSAACRFGPEGGSDLLAALREFFGQTAGDVHRLMARAGYAAELLAVDHEQHWRYTPR